MATSGILNTTAYTGTYGNRYLELTWERKSFNVVAQTSTISWKLVSRGTYKGYFTSAPFSVVIDGEEVYASSRRIKLYANQDIANGTKVIQHNTDGTKTFAATVRGAIYSSAYNVSGSQTFTLDLVGMASISKAPNFNDEENPTIEYYNPVGNAITSLQAAISLTGEAPDVAYRDIPIASGKYTFTLTAAERKTLRAATVGSNSRKVRFYLRNVVEGNIYFSWKEVNYTVINTQPTITYGVVDSNANTIALTGDNKTLIRYHSTAYATMGATAKKEATITETKIEHKGGTSIGSTYTVNNVEGNTFTFIATDNRGNTSKGTLAAPMIDYIKPTANVDTTKQIDTSGVYSLSVDGNCYNGSFGNTSAAKANTITVEYRIKTQNGNYGSWTSVATSLNGNEYTATKTITGLDYRTTYVIQCRIRDLLSNVETAEVIIRSLPVFHWSNDDFVFEVPVKFNDGIGDGDLDIMGDLWLKNTGNDGNTIHFGDNTYCYITEATDNTMTIKSTKINLEGNVSVNGSPIGGASATSGTWTPTLTTAAAVSSYTTRSGWYQKIGSVVTIGWQIEATINSGYDNNTVAISGCPFTPAYSAFGGGMAHNVAFIANYNFEGWALGTDGLLTLRGQPCNATTMVNLNTTSSAYYPTGGSSQVMTLAGTICFITS